MDGFNTVSIYQVLPKLIELWGLNVQTDVEAKKTSPDRAGNDNAVFSPAVCTVGSKYTGAGASLYWDDDYQHVIIPADELIDDAQSGTAKLDL